MADASRGIEASMVAITGIDYEKVEECCKKAETEGIVSVCNINCPDQFVIGGDKEAVEKVAHLAKESGARRCVKLAVSGPFHTEYMRPAGALLSKEFKKISFAVPKCEVLFNYLGGPNIDNRKIDELLIRQIQCTVHMKECIEYLIDDDVKNFVEIGPGTALSGFIKKTLKGLNKNVEHYTILDINTVDDIKQVCDLIEH